MKCARTGALGFLFALVVCILLATALVPAASTSAFASHAPTQAKNFRYSVSDDCDYATVEELTRCVQGKSLEQAPAEAAPPQSNVVAGNPYPYTVEEYLNYIIKDLDTEWTKWFKASSFEEPNVAIAMIEPGATFASNCLPQAVTDTHPNAYYCDRDLGEPINGQQHYGSLILPVTTFQRMWTGDLFGRTSKTAGDFAAAIITAHEFGHHVQDELRQQYNTNATALLADPNLPNKELIADCFAGNWAASAYYTGLLQPGDFDEAVAALSAIGDPGSGGTHGTADQRKAAVMTGYNGLPGITQPGDPIACIRTYWK